MVTDQEAKALVGQLAAVLEDINAVRRDLDTTSGVSPNVRGPFKALLERAAVGVEGVRIVLRAR